MEVPLIDSQPINNNNNVDPATVSTNNNTATRRNIPRLHDTTTTNEKDNNDNTTTKQQVIINPTNHKIPTLVIRTTNPSTIKNEDNNTNLKKKKTKTMNIMNKIKQNKTFDNAKKNDIMKKKANEQDKDDDNNTKKKDDQDQNDDNNNNNNGYEVQLAIYDLSQGKALSLSAKLLGMANYAVDIVPHTSIIVYGREYFYRRRISSDDPNLFRQRTGLQPIQIISLGYTKVSRYEFENWCLRVQKNDMEYSELAYDLINRNSNHFCKDAIVLGLCMETNVPNWIFNVPLQFPLSFSLGQFLLPMIPSYQNEHHNPCLLQRTASTTTTTTNKDDIEMKLDQAFQKSNNNNNNNNNSLQINVMRSFSSALAFITDDDGSQIRENPSCQQPKQQLKQQIQIQKQLPPSGGGDDQQPSTIKRTNTQVSHDSTTTTSTTRSEHHQNNTIGSDDRGGSISSMSNSNSRSEHYFRNRKYYQQMMMMMTSTGSSNSKKNNVSSPPPSYSHKDHQVKIIWNIDNTNNNQYHHHQDDDEHNDDDDDDDDMIMNAGVDKKNTNMNHQRSNGPFLKTIHDNDGDNDDDDDNDTDDNSNDYEQQAAVEVVVGDSYNNNNDDNDNENNHRSKNRNPLPIILGDKIEESSVVASRSNRSYDTGSSSGNDNTASFLNKTNSSTHTSIACRHLNTTATSKAATTTTTLVDNKMRHPRYHPHHQQQEQQQHESVDSNMNEIKKPQQHSKEIGKEKKISNNNNNNKTKKPVTNQVTVETNETTRNQNQFSHTSGSTRADDHADDTAHNDTQSISTTSQTKNVKYNIICNDDDNSRRRDSNNNNDHQSVYSRTSSTSRKSQRSSTKSGGGGGSIKNLIHKITNKLASTNSNHNKKKINPDTNRDDSSATNHHAASETKSCHSYYVERNIPQDCRSPSSTTNTGGDDSRHYYKEHDDDDAERDNDDINNNDIWSHNNRSIRSIPLQSTSSIKNNTATTTSTRHSKYEDKNDELIPTDRGNYSNAFIRSIHHPTNNDDYTSSEQDYDMNDNGMKPNSNNTDIVPCTDLFTKPLISTDTKAIPTCMIRLCRVIKKIQFADPSQMDVSLTILNRVQTKMLLGEPLNIRIAEGFCNFLFYCFERNTSIIHALLVLRIVVLNTPPSVTSSCYEWLVQELIITSAGQQQQQQQSNTETNDSSSVLRQPVARSLGWLVVCNATTSRPSAVELHHLIHAAIADLKYGTSESSGDRTRTTTTTTKTTSLQQQQQQLKQAACAFLYNVILLQMIRFQRRRPQQQHHQQPPQSNRSIDSIDDGGNSSIVETITTLSTTTTRTTTTPTSIDDDDDNHSDDHSDVLSSQSQQPGQEDTVSSSSTTTTKMIRLIAVACMDGLKEETDSTTLLRRLMVFIRILMPYESATCTIQEMDLDHRKLFIQLGLRNTLIRTKEALTVRIQKNMMNQKNNDDENKISNLVMSELIKLLS